MYISISNVGPYMEKNILNENILSLIYTQDRLKNTAERSNYFAFLFFLQYHQQLVAGWLLHVI